MMLPSDQSLVLTSPPSGEEPDMTVDHKTFSTGFNY